MAKVEFMYARQHNVPVPAFTPNPIFTAQAIGTSEHPLVSAEIFVNGSPVVATQARSDAGPTIGSPSSNPRYGINNLYGTAHCTGWYWRQESAPYLRVGDVVTVEVVDAAGDVATRSATVVDKGGLTGLLALA